MILEDRIISIHRKLPYFVTSQVPDQRGEALNLMTEDVITYWLIRPITHLKAQRQMSMEQWWNDD
jgi:hypothetical protein